MRRISPLVAVLCVAAGVTAQSPAGPAKVTASAVWQMPASFVDKAHAACDKSQNFAACLTGQMLSAGAPAAAINFTRELYHQTGGEFGIITAFQDEGPVASASITYPLRANTNNGLLLVNGQPHIVNVEDLSMLDRKAMENDPQFQRLKNQFPSVDLWPGDRDGKTWPKSQAGPDGGRQFVLDYPLIDGCHACARAGLAWFAWNFDAQGKFLGTSFQRITPPPVP